MLAQNLCYQAILRGLPALFTTANAASVATLIDRLTHQAEILQIDGESYRLKESRDSAEKRLLRRTELKRPKKS